MDLSHPRIRQDPGPTVASRPAARALLGSTDRAGLGDRGPTCRSTQKKRPASSRELTGLLLWSRLSESNRRQPAYKAGALPTELRRHAFKRMHRPEKAQRSARDDLLYVETSVADSSAAAAMAASAREDTPAGVLPWLSPKSRVASSSASASSGRKSRSSSAPGRIPRTANCCVAAYAL